VSDRIGWRAMLPESVKVVRVSSMPMLIECWPWVKERLETIKKKDKTCGHWLPEHIRHMVQEGITNRTVRYPVELYLALDESSIIHSFLVGYTKFDPYINVPLTYHIWVAWLNRKGIEQLTPWLDQMCKDRGLTSIEFESGRFGWMGALRKAAKSGFYVKQTVYRKELL